MPNNLARYNSTHYGNELESDLTVLPGWKTADAITRTRIIEAAKRYLLEQDANTSEWLGTNIIHGPAFAGYRALQLLWQDATDFIYTFPPDIWQKWAPIILAYPTASSLEEAKIYHELVRITYQNTPAEIIDTLLTLIDKENEEHGHIFVTYKLENCWDDRLARAMLIKLKEGKLKPNSMGILLEELLKHDVSEAGLFAKALIPLPPPAGENERHRVLIAARVLVTCAQDAGWDIVWPAMQQDTEFGKELITAVAHGANRRTISVYQRLTEDQLANLYIWLVRQYPHTEDPARATGPVNFREAVADWRDDLLRHLKELGTPQACNEIQRLINELPELDWLKWTLLEAKNLTRFRTWVPPQPIDIFKLANSQEACLVQNGNQLIEALVQSLERLELKLQGETSAAIDLWNYWLEDGKRVYRPKDENDISNYVKRYFDDDLKQRGIIVNREVEFRRGSGSGQGERTDIHVDAVTLGPNREIYDSVTVIVEVKGCWHLELNSAMKTQLVDRYLKDSQCQHGLYLVSWFNCDQWDNKDYRKGNAPQLLLQEAQQLFDAQAVRLSQQDLRQVKAFVINAALRQ